MNELLSLKVKLTYYPGGRAAGGHFTCGSRFKNSLLYLSSPRPAQARHTVVPGHVYSRNTATTETRLAL